MLIGHSQGSFELIQLIAKDIDPKPKVLARLVSAILLGGNVLVKRGKGIGGNFRHIPACRSATQLPCVIAFSTFDRPVPNSAFFGRPGAIPGRPAPAGDVVLCTNPAALGGGSGVLTPILASRPLPKSNPLYGANLLLNLHPPHPRTVFWTVPNAYTARCSSANNAHVLQITPLHGAEKPTPSPTPAWGLHLLDANIALSNLVAIVDAEARRTSATAASDGRGCARRSRESAGRVSPGVRGYRAGRGRPDRHLPLGLRAGGRVCRDLP